MACSGIHLTQHIYPLIEGQITINYAYCRILQSFEKNEGDRE